MTLNDLLLQKLSEWRPPGPGRHSLAVRDEATEWTAVVTADRADELGCLVWELTLLRPAADHEPGLQAWAERAAGRVTGLLEPLEVLEVDGLRQEALLRSDEPGRRGGQSYYYEVHLRGTHEARVRRYQAAQPGQRREQVAFALTHEALAKLAADLTAE